MMSSLTHTVYSLTKYTVSPGCRSTLSGSGSSPSVGLEGFQISVIQYIAAYLKNKSSTHMSSVYMVLCMLLCIHPEHVYIGDVMLIMDVEVYG